jgi:hypothetical protein
MALGSCSHRITHQLRPINMNGRSILAVTSLIETLIRSAETSGEFRSLVYGWGDVTLEPLRVDGRGECVGGNPPERKGETHQ